VAHVQAQRLAHDVHRSHDSVVVVQRLAHAHEHHVGDARVSSRVGSKHAARHNHLRGRVAHMRRYPKKKQHVSVFEGAGAQAGNAADRLMSQRPLAHAVHTLQFSHTALTRPHISVGMCRRRVLLCIFCPVHMLAMLAVLPVLLAQATSHAVRDSCRCR
jgi:hypothetical protein